MEKLSLVLSLALCMTILFSGNVFAKDEESSNKNRMGTPQDWQDLKSWVGHASLVWHGYYKSSKTSISNVPYGVVIPPISLVDSEKTKIIFKNF